MDYQVIWTPRGLASLREIADYVAARNPDAAHRLGRRLLDRVELIRRHPLAGERFRPLQRNDIRDYPVPPLRLIYRVNESERRIFILTVWHGARDEPELDLSDFDDAPCK